MPALALYLVSVTQSRGCFALAQAPYLAAQNQGPNWCFAAPYLAAQNLAPNSELLKVAVLPKKQLLVQAVPDKVPLGLLAPFGLFQPAKA